MEPAFDGGIDVPDEVGVGEPSSLEAVGKTLPEDGPSVVADVAAVGVFSGGAVIEELEAVIDDLETYIVLLLDMAVVLGLGHCPPALVVCNGLVVPEPPHRADQDPMGSSPSSFANQHCPAVSGRPRSCAQVLSK